MLRFPRSVSARVRDAWPLTCPASPRSGQFFFEFLSVVFFFLLGGGVGESLC